MKNIFEQIQMNFCGNLNILGLLRNVSDSKKVHAYSNFVVLDANF